jgi:hypothetical protein
MVAPRFEDGTDLWLLCPTELWEAVMRTPDAPPRRFPGTVDVRRYPLISAHAAMGAATGLEPLARLLSDHKLLILALAVGVCLVVAAPMVLSGAAVAGATATAATEAAVAAGATEAAVGAGVAVAEEAAATSLAAYRAARSAKAVIAVATEVTKAAAVLMVVVTTRQASAKSPAAVTRASAVRAVDSKDLPVYYEYGLSREVLYMNTPCRIVGRARATR